MAELFEDTLAKANAGRFDTVHSPLSSIDIFFTPIPCTYTSSPLDGMAKNYFYFSTWIRKIMQFIMSGSILFLPPYTRGEKKHLV